MISYTVFIYNYINTIYIIQLYGYNMCYYHSEPLHLFQMHLELKMCPICSPCLPVYWWKKHQTSLQRV